MTNPLQAYPDPATVIRTSQIIASALMAGVTVFGVIAVAMGGKVQPRQPIVAYIAILLAAQVVALRFFIPNLVVNSRLKSLKESGLEAIKNQLPALFQTRMIIGLALLEGAAFFNLVSYLIEGQWFSIGVAGFLLALMAMMFPTIRKYDLWADEALQSVNSNF